VRINKRELAISILLYEVYGEREVNIEDVIGILRSRLCFTRRTALSIIKRLRKTNFITVKVREDSIKVYINNPLESLKRILGGYIEKRSSKCLT